jgi:hypothetical protein
VSLGKLGSSVILSVTQEARESARAEFRQMRLSGIEEVPVAAPRIARAVILDVPVEETQKVDNLVGEETRVPKSKPGSLHFAMGLIGMFAPLDQGVSLAPGLDIDLHHQTGDGRWEIGGNFRFAVGEPTGGPSTDLVALSVGGKHFTSDGDFSPYIGGGLAWSYLHLRPEGGVDYGGDGVGAYADVGVEFLRTWHAHVALDARWDLPFYSISGSSYSYPVAYSQGTNYAQYTPAKYYYAPISLEVRITF